MKFIGEESIENLKRLLEKEKFYQSEKIDGENTPLLNKLKLFEQNSIDQILSNTSTLSNRICQRERYILAIHCKYKIYI